MTLAAGAAGAVLGAAAAPALLAVAYRFEGVRRTTVRTVVTICAAALAGAALAVRLVPDPRLRYALPAFAAMASAGVVLVVVDLATYRLPDVVTLPAYPVLGGLLALASLLADDWPALLRGTVTGLAGLALYAALHYAAPHGLGYGDVKLAGSLGLLLGWQSWTAAVAGLVLGFACGGLVSLGLLAVRRASLRTELPFGPSMLAGALLAVLGGDQLVRLYLAW